MISEVAPETFVWYTYWRSVAQFPASSVIWRPRLQKETVKRVKVKMYDTPTVYGCSTIPLKKTKQSKVSSALHSPLANFAFGVLFGFCIGYAFAYLDYGPGVNFIYTSDCNFTKVMKSKHLELTSGVSQFLLLFEEVDESRSPYSDDIIHQKGITDLKDLQESMKPKVRRRPPLETLNSTTPNNYHEKWCIYIPSCSRQYSHDGHYSHLQTRWML